MTADHEHQPGLRDLVEQRLNALERLIEVQRTADLLAVKTALDASKELAEKHNDLLRAMEKKDETYASKAEVARLVQAQAKLGGGILVLGAIGITNLVKLWS